MRTRGGVLLPFAALVAAIALLASASSALAVNGQDLVALAQGAPYNMICIPNGSDAHCDQNPNAPFTRDPVTADVTPGSGTLKTLHTRGTESDGPLIPATTDWMVAMHTLACGDKAGVSSFVTFVTGLTKDGTAGPTTVGTCTMTGDATFPVTGGFPFFRIHSSVIPPVTPKPTVKPTPKPTPKPTVAPTATAEPSASPEPSPSPTVEPSPTASPSPSPSPTGVVAPVEVTPAPSATPPAGGGGKGGGSSFVDSIPDFDGVATDATSVGGSALLALILLLIGFAAELFNNTVENNYDEVSGWFKKGPLGGLNAWIGRHARTGVLAFLILTALVSSFVDPSFGLTVRSLFEFLGFLVGVIVVLASFKGPPMLAHRRKTGELGHLRPLPWALVIAAAFVLVSRVGNLQPGYLYGIVLGAIFTREVSDREEGRETVYGSIWTLFVSLAAWAGLTFVRGLGLPSDDPAGTFALTALGAILVSGLEATAFGLMPLRFMPGYAIYRWNRAFWAVLFGLSVFAFIHILIGPTSGYVSALNPAAFVAAGGVFAIFGAFSIATWGYFRFRPAAGAQDLER